MLNTILTKMKSFAKDETGASAIEYAVMAAVLIVVIAIAIALVGDGLETSFGKISGSIDTAATGAGS